MFYNRAMHLTRLKHFFNRTKFRIHVWNALYSRRPLPFQADRIIIDLSHCCDLSCPDCNRSCATDQAPADEFISLEQIRRFVNESIASGRRWRRILLEGGEPTLHPQLEEIIAELQRYRRDHAPQCKIDLNSNGYSPRAKHLLTRLPNGFRAKNSAKVPGYQKHHIAFNVAPVDLPEFAGADYGQGCYIQRIFGLGLTRSGFYPHPICAGIDRVFGFDVGLKKLPARPADLEGQLRRLCPLCGHFREYRFEPSIPLLMRRRDHRGFSSGYRSPSWVKAYRDFRLRPPTLTSY
ncbi:MAG TPA: radical SAM protein [Candidatus Binatia bacterium]|nr:radical SAM protein [Candidatus Binatia bacterium]